MYGIALHFLVLDSIGLYHMVLHFVVWYCIVSYSCVIVVPYNLSW